MEMESILISLRQSCGPTAEQTHFDPEIIMHINSIFMDLNQMGVGPDEGFEIEDDTTVWTDFIADVKKLAAVKSYMSLRLRLIFDPPASSAVIETMQRAIDKWEWRLNSAVDFAES